MVEAPARSMLPMIAFRDALCITHNRVIGTAFGIRDGFGHPLKIYPPRCQVDVRPRDRLARESEVARPVLRLALAAASKNSPIRTTAQRLHKLIDARGDTHGSTTKNLGAPERPSP
jgi:hypothetical protein